MPALGRGEFLDAASRLDFIDAHVIDRGLGSGTTA